MVLLVAVGALLQHLAELPHALLVGLLLGVLVAPWVPAAKDRGGCE